MPDIAKCSNKSCPSKNECYRYRVKPSDYWQSYAGFKHDDSGKCDEFKSISDVDEKYLLEVVE